MIGVYVLLGLAVKKQKEDLPYDSENPLFPFGHGLTYGA